MQNNIIKHDLLDNTVDSFVVINPTKQQLAFFPKEESQMFTSKTQNYTGPITGFATDSENESENGDTRAFIQRAKTESGFTPSVIGGSSGLNGTDYGYKLDTINSSHTPTDYIGATTISVPHIINETFADFKLYSLSSNSITNLYADEDTVQKIRSVFNGLQTIRIPVNVFNTILEDEADVIANNNSEIVKNYGKYYVSISPKYIRTTVGNINEREHVDWLNMPSNANWASIDSKINVTPDVKRRTVYECNNENFMDLEWNFEDSGKQSGRLYGSIVEVWDSSETTLKQVKIMTENDFDFENTTMKFVLYPDNVGYDAPEQIITTGDVLRVFPRETNFNQILLEISYKSEYAQVENLLSFMLNDTVRNMKTGIYEVYDEDGFTLDTSGNFVGTVLHRFQVFQANAHEARKRIKF